MNRIFEYTITPSDVPCTVGEYLKKKGYSRQIIIHLKKTEHGILQNGEWAYVRTPLVPGDVLKITLLEESASEHILPVPMEPDIVYEDEDLLVVNKPFDMPVHPSIHNYDNTLANGMAYYFQQKGETFIFRCINRLDRDTTGLLILAKNALSASILSNDMKARKIHRTYQAVVSRIPVPASGTIDAPIARKEDSAIERCVDFEKGEPAVTHYRTLETKENLALVELSLETGRTHQIRVHMQHIGCPLLGDYLYHPDFTLINRVALHSYSLTFDHPITGKSMYFCAPLPKDMAGLLS
ncbi:MAG: RluA family pseudouridine synthase [Blautia sp.]|uniref:RluA family pseudouridine synthase n=1 Tax=Blautia sp. TaxID=1955243 RepID=UPI002E79E500|nr:RluA family pseudouridine synthase [Blautia sp.]MEE1442208.1 RluA family pseudouridine synthase [Blautia sp.]